MIDHLVQPDNARFKRFFAVLVKEELGIAQARTHHALVAANDQAGIGRADVTDHQEFMGEFACRVQQRKVLLVGLHGQDQALLRHVQKLGFKLADQHIGALHQRGDFVQQGLVVNRLATTSHLGRRCGELAHDLGAALGKTGNHRAVLGQCVRVNIGLSNHDRGFERLKPVSLRGVAGGQAQHFHRHHRSAMHRHQTMRRAHKMDAAPARQFAITFQLVTHHLWNRQFGNCHLKCLLQTHIQRGTAHQAVVKQGFGFAVQGFAQRGHDKHRVGHIGTQGLQFLQQGRGGQAIGIQADAHRHQLLLHRLVSSFGSDVGDVSGQTAR
ncbi:hypothetical protein GALL_491860 [mine drainage metagenome]|uniref:Uncharacterized protein n=1 Tax=mine drainage metagenome TaxID=410659 RepID=A0A1J5PEK5_9ZZZZ